MGFSVIVQPRIEGVGRVDLRVGKLLIECDSKAHHTSMANYRNDRRRDRCALVRGWLKMRLTYEDVVYAPAVIASGDRDRPTGGPACP